MASFDKSLVHSPPHSPTSISSQSGYPFYRKTSSSSSSSSSSTTSQSISPISTTISPKVQLVPYARSASSQSSSFSDVEREILDKASFDALDLSSQDFDFEDIFTYDKPQKKLAKVVEVSRPTRSQRDWSNFSFSHYPAAVHARQKVNGKVRAGFGAGEAHGKNGGGARKA